MFLPARLFIYFSQKVKILPEVRFLRKPYSSIASRQSIVSNHPIVAEDRLTTLRVGTATLFLICDGGCDRVEAGESKPGIAVCGATGWAPATISDSCAIATPASHSPSEPDGETRSIPDTDTLSVSYCPPQISGQLPVLLQTAQHWLDVVRAVGRKSLGERNNIE